MPFKDYKQTILVTGSHRSGSTWLGQMLSIGGDVAYIHEPLNIGLEKIKDLNPPIKNTFEYIGEKSDKGLVKNIESYLDIADTKLSKRNVNLGLNKQSLIIKDPIAFMSAEWFAKTYNSKIIVLIRHPAAFVSSLKIKNWYFDFNNLLNQPELIDDVLFPFREKIEFFARKPQHIIDQAILLWNIFYYRTRIYELQYPSWLYVKHEDLSREPLEKIKWLYEQLNLNYTPAIEKEILKAVKPDVKTEFQRDSKANILAWKDRLSKEEIIKIKRETREISEIYYTEADWGEGDDANENIGQIPNAITQRNKSDHKHKYSLEIINDRKTDDIQSLDVRDENIILKGWALGKEDKMARGVILRIGGQYFEARYGSPRVDVAQFYKNKEIALCGFEMAISTTKLKKGDNRITMLILDETTYTEQTFHVNLIIK